MAAYTTIDDPEAYFQVSTYAGNASNPRTITLDGDTDMQPDMIFQKNRTENNGWTVADSVRGANKTLSCSSNALEITDKNDGHIDAFTSDGYTVGAGSSSDARVNDSGDNYVAFCWKESATSGFDIVTATGNATAKTIAHSLSAVPHVIFSKEKSGSVNDWVVYHHRNTSAPETDNLILNETNATSDYPYWNDTTPTSSVFSVGTGSVVNRSGSTYVYYLWSEKQGFSKFGSYTGNGDADGPFIYTGFKPAWIMYKPSSAVDNWEIIDNKRTNAQLGNPKDELLYANLDNAEGTDQTDRLDILSNGFKIRTGSSDYNGSGTSYIYAAFAESPFVNSNGVPTNAR